MLLEEITEICQVPGISGREERVRKFIISKLPQGVEYRVDAIGNLVVSVGDGRKTVCFMAHMDEIGFLITGILPNGNLTFRKVGGFDDRVALASHVTVITKDKQFDGVIGITPPHLSKELSSEELSIDVGTSTYEETENLGISVMDYAVFKKHVSFLNNKFIAVRSLDDRFGCLALIKTLREIHRVNLKRRIDFVWTVQEEIGLKGAKAYASNNKPDVCYAVDSFACCSRLTGNVKLGEGPVLRMADNSAIASYEEMKKIVKIAKQSGIPLQIGVTGGGTDGSVMMEHNTKMVPITLAVKYLHSQAEYISVKDFEHLVKLLVCLAKG